MTEGPRGKDFDAAAATWDEAPRRVKLAADVTAAIRAAVELRPDAAALEIGCGTGLVALALAPEVASIVGADGSARMLEVLEEKARARGVPNVRTRRIDLDGEEPLGGPFDAIVSSMTLHHVRDVDALLARVFSALRPGGVAALADLEPDGGLFHDDNAGVFHFGFDPAPFARRLEAAGFTNARLSLAATLDKEIDGARREFRVFLAAARKPR